MRIGWIGFHEEGRAALKAVVDTFCRAESAVDVVGLMTLPPDRAQRRSAAGDYSDICQAAGIPVHSVSHVNDDDSRAILRDWNADVVFVLGWSQILSEAALATAKLGMIGAHASLLPKNRGSAPVNWAIIRGERETGNSLIWLDAAVDSGHVIDQRQFAIQPWDTCATIYDRVADSNRDMVLDVIPRLINGERPGHPQKHNPDDEILPRRRPADGIVNWDSAGSEIYNFVRALTRPYPGAFGYLNNEKLLIWKAAVLPMDAALGEPGRILGPVYSPESSACGQLVACRAGGVVLLEVENADGTILRGTELCEQPWQGKVWSDAA